MWRGGHAGVRLGMWVCMWIACWEWRVSAARRLTSIVVFPREVFFLRLILLFCYVTVNNKSSVQGSTLHNSSGQ